jgi:periplasmic divalent cation tolerance protein
MDRAVFVYTTFPGLVEAEEAAKVIVERRLAACANILPGMISHYRWQGKVERGQEVVALFKTRASLAEPQRAAIKQLHDYDVPAISMIPIESVDRDYLDWLMDETKAGVNLRLTPAPGATLSCALSKSRGRPWR